LAEAKKLCPHLICQHVATWKEGEDKWAYHEDAASNIATHKVSLDPYRLESRKIINLIKESLPQGLQKVEKAGIDEVFVDLSAQVHSILLERFPELTKPPPYDDVTEKLPMPSTVALDWKADALVDLDDENAEADDPDWDDVALLIGSEIVRGVRTTIKERLKYTCSAGISSNKMVSKLGSGYKKPNQQTVIRPRAVQHFMTSHKVTRIRNLGGKLGDQVVKIFGTDSVQELLPVPMEQLKLKLGDDTGAWVYNTIRGVDSSEVTSRTQIKSMLSAKSFRPHINSFDQGVRWLRIFAADIFFRLVDEGVLENKRRPKTITLHHSSGGVTRSRQSPIPQGRPLDEATLFDLAQHLLSQIVLEGHVWPCYNLSLTVAGIEDGITGNMGIGAFLVKGEEAKALQSTSRMSSSTPPASDQQPAIKRRRADDGAIHRFFTRMDASKDDPHHSDSEHAGSTGSPGKLTGGYETHQYLTMPEDDVGQHPSGHICPECHQELQTRDEMQNHMDWHMAKMLQDEEDGRVRPALASRPAAPAGSTSRSVHESAASSSKRAVRPKKTDPGQSKLKFG
jgi:DNA polymerase eta